MIASMEQRPAETESMHGAEDHDADVPVIALTQAMPGFPQDLRFALVRLGEDTLLSTFRSLDSEGLEFLVVPPAPFYPDLTLELDDEVVADLDLTGIEEVLVLLVVKAQATLAETTVNLRAPLIVNTRTRRGRQVILDDVDLPISAPLVG